MMKRKLQTTNYKQQTNFKKTITKTANKGQEKGRAEERKRGRVEKESAINWCTFYLGALVAK